MGAAFPLQVLPISVPKMGGRWACLAEQLDFEDAGGDHDPGHQCEGDAADPGEPGGEGAGVEDLVVLVDDGKAVPEVI